MSTSITTLENGHASTPNPESAHRLHSIVSNHPVALDFQQRTPTINISRSVLVLKPEDLPSNLTQATLAGSDTITPPFVFKDDVAGSLLAFYQLGRKVAGHTGIVHGGIAAVLLDECMGRACFPRLPGKIAVTAKLELEYKSPIPVGSVILIRADTTDVQGRKAWVEAIVQDAEGGRDLVKATALFIQPKWAPDMTQII